MFADPDARDAAVDISDNAYLDHIDSALSVLNSSGSSNQQFFSAKNSFVENTTALNQNLFDLSEQPINAQANVYTALSLPGKALGISVYASATAVFETAPIITVCDQTILNGYVDFMDLIDTEADILANGTESIDCVLVDGTTTTIDFVDVDTSDPANPQASITDPAASLTSRVLITGVAITEFGIALSHQFVIAGLPISIGVTPKYMELTSYFADPSVQEIDDPNFDLGDVIRDNEKTDTDFNVDVGVAVSFFDDNQLTLGFMAKNLISNTYTTAEYNGRSTSYDIEPQLRMGISWAAPMGITLAGDLDLTSNSPYFRLGDNTQYMGVGIEWDVLNALRLRGGVRTNLENTDDTAFTAGVGVNIIAVHIDLAGQISENNGGAALQFGVDF